MSRDEKIIATIRLAGLMIGYITLLVGLVIGTVAGSWWSFIAMVCGGLTAMLSYIAIEREV